MLHYQTTDKLRAMKLFAMAAEYNRQMETPVMSALDFEERMGMMADAEYISRENNRIGRLTKEANLRFTGASLADIDYRPSRKLDRSTIARLSDFTWAKDARNLLITGATGTGKTWLACAFGTAACRLGMRVLFFRANRLLNEMTVASGVPGAGGVGKLLAKLKKADILILDDWGLAALNPIESRFLLEVFEDRYGERATILLAQLPVAKWHGLFEDSTVADAILDRLVHNAHRLELQGPSLRTSADKVKTDTVPGGTQNQEPYPKNDNTVTDVKEGGDTGV